MRNICGGHKKCLWKPSETFLVAARRAIMLPRFATNEEHHRTHCCRHNVSSCCQGLRFTRLFFVLIKGGAMQGLFHPRRQIHWRSGCRGTFSPVFNWPLFSGIGDESSNKLCVRSTDRSVTRSVNWSVDLSATQPASRSVARSVGRSVVPPPIRHSINLWTNQSFNQSTAHTSSGNQ